MRHFLRELPDAVQNAIDLGRIIKLFTFKWIKLNCEILRGGSAALKSLLDRTAVRGDHARQTEMTAIKVALEKSVEIVIDGYVMDGKSIRQLVFLSKQGS